MCAHIITKTDKEVVNKAIKAGLQQPPLIEIGVSGRYLPHISCVTGYFSST